MNKIFRLHLFDRVIPLPTSIKIPLSDGKLFCFCYVHIDNWTDNCQTALYWTDILNAKRQHIWERSMNDVYLTEKAIYCPHHSRYLLSDGKLFGFCHIHLDIRSDNWQTALPLDKYSQCRSEECRSIQQKKTGRLDILYIIEASHSFNSDVQLVWSVLCSLVNILPDKSIGKVLFKCIHISKLEQ